MGYTNQVDVIWVSKNAGHPPNGYFFQGDDDELVDRME